MAGALVAAAVICAVLASSAGAVSMTAATTNVRPGDEARVTFQAGSGAHDCQITAQAGRAHLGPLRYAVSQPLVVLTGQVPRDARSLAWTLTVRCASSQASAARARAATVHIHVAGRRKGAAVLFGRGSIHVRAYSVGASVAPEPEQAKGGKGGYVCASAWDGYRSVLDASSYCTGYCTWFAWKKRPEAQLKDLGNAWEWWGGAKARGIPEGSSPVVGAVAWWGISAHAPEGHVAYVIGASASSVTIEEMNRVAWDVADTRTISLSSGEAPNGYIYGGPAGDGPGSAGGGGTPGGSGSTPGESGSTPNGSYGVAMQANTGALLVSYLEANHNVAWTTNTGLGMMSGTSPSVAPAPGGGYTVAFQANTGALLVSYLEANHNVAWTTNTGLGMMSDTSPSIAAGPNGSYGVAMQANTGALLVSYLEANHNVAWTTNTGLGMMSDTSPSIGG
jgi:surface antigen